MTSYTIDASNLDTDTYYPVVMNLSPTNNTRIEIEVALNSGTKPAWATHSSGFSVRKIWESNGNGQGTINITRRILVSTYGWATSDPVRGIGQLNQGNKEYVYVRGGGKYFFKVSIGGGAPTLCSNTYEVYGQSVSPTTTAPKEITTDFNNYVLKTGDSMSGKLSIATGSFAALVIQRNDDSNGASIQFRGNTNIYGYIGFNNSARDKQLQRWNSAANTVYTILDTSSTRISDSVITINGTSITVSKSDHNHDGRYVRYYTVTSLDCNNLANGFTAARTNASNAANSNHSAFLYVSDVGTPFQLQFPDSSNFYVYKRYKSSGSWSTWAKLSAGYADHAGYLDNIFTVFGVEYNGSQAKSVIPSNFVSQLSEGTSTVTDGTMLITSYASDNGFADSNAVNIPYKRKAIHLWEYIANKADVRYTRYYNNHDLNIDSFTDQNYIQTAASQGGNWTGISPSGSHNGKAVLNVHTHTGNYYSQLMLDTAQNRLWMRSANNTTTYGNWFKIAYVSDIPTKDSWNYDDRYLQLTGGTMAGTAYITWADSGSWSAGTGAQGGLKWSGQSDYAWLYAEETAGDNLDLVIKFGDDNSNGLSIRNVSNVQTTYISANGIISTGTFKGNLDWSYITNKPSFYTKAESDAKYVTSLGTSGRNLTWTKNGTTNNITVPFATYSSALKSTGDDGNWYNWVYWNGSYFWLKAGTSIYNNSTATLKTAVDYSTMSSYLKDNGTHSETASGTTANAANAGMLYGSGMYMTRTYNDSSMPTSYGNVINVAGGGSGQLLLGWSGSDSTTGNIYYRSHRDTATGGWGSWVTLLATNNYASILDSRYYTESEVNNLLSKKLDRVNLTTGSWNPRGYNLAADYHYNGGDVSFAESGGQMHVSIDGKFWQNEGKYRVLDTSDLSGIYNNVTLNQYLSSSDTAWWPLIWGGSAHNNTNNSTGQLYKSYSALTWQTSSQTLYTTKLRTTGIIFPDIGNAATSGKISWNGSTDGADIYYQTTTSDQGNLVLNVRDDNNCYIRLALNGTFKSYFDVANSYWSGSSYNSDHLSGKSANVSDTQKPFGKIPVIGSDGVTELGRYIDFHYDNTTNSDYSTRLQVQGNYSNVVNLPTASGTLALTSDFPMKYYAQYHMNPNGTIYSKHGNTDFISSSSKSATGHYYITLKSSVASYNTFIWGSGYCVSTVSSASGTNTNTSLSVTIARTYDYGFYVNTAQGSTKVDAHYYLHFLYFS